MASDAIPIALTFDKTVDVTGLGTAALALATAWLALTTRRLARGQQREVEYSQRPVVVPYQGPERVPHPSGFIDANGPTGYGNQLIVPVVNVGTGPALAVGGIINTYPGGVKGPIPAIAAGGRTAITFLPAPGREVQTDPFEFEVTVGYSDVSGKAYETKIQWPGPEKAPMYWTEVGDPTF